MVPDATADPNNTGNGRGAILGIRLGGTGLNPPPGTVIGIADGTNVAPPLIAPAFRRPRAAAVDPRNESFILVADSDAEPTAGITAVGAPNDPEGALLWVNRTTGQVSLFSDGTAAAFTLPPFTSAFVNPAALAFSSGCYPGGRDTPCKVYILDETANPRCGAGPTSCLVSPWTGKKPGAIYQIEVPTPGGSPAGLLDVRSIGCDSDLFPLPGGCAVNQTIFGQLRGLVAVQNTNPNPLTFPYDILYVADSSADDFGAELGGSGRRPGVIWQVGTKGPVDPPNAARVLLAVDGQTGTPSPPGPFTTPFAVAVNIPVAPATTPSTLYFADADKAPTGLAATAGEPVLPGSLYSASILSGDPTSGSRFNVNGQNAGGSPNQPPPLPNPPPCLTLGTHSIFVNPAGLLVLQDDDLSPSKQKLIVTDADARLGDCTLTQRFDFVRPGGVFVIDLASGVGGTVTVVSTGTSCATGCAALPPGSTSYFSTPQRPALYRDPVFRCKETAKVVLDSLPVSDLCYQNAPAKTDLQQTLSDMANADACDCTSYANPQRIVNKINTNLTCPAACPDPNCATIKQNALCRFCRLYKYLGCTPLPPPYPAGCPVDPFDPAQCPLN